MGKSSPQLQGAPRRCRWRRTELAVGRLDRWSYRDSTHNVSIDFGRLRATELLLESAKQVLAWYAANRSASHLSNMFGRLQHFLRIETDATGALVAEITPPALMRFRGAFGPEREWYLGSLAGFLRKWHDLRLPGVTDDAAALLKQIRLRGNSRSGTIVPGAAKPQA